MRIAPAAEVLGIGLAAGAAGAGSVRAGAGDPASESDEEELELEELDESLLYRRTGGVVVVIFEQSRDRQPRERERDGVSSSLRLPLFPTG